MYPAAHCAKQTSPSTSGGRWVSLVCSAASVLEWLCCSRAWGVWGASLGTTRGGCVLALVSGSTNQTSTWPVYPSPVGGRPAALLETFPTRLLWSSTLVSLSWRFQLQVWKGVCCQECAGRQEHPQAGKGTPPSATWEGLVSRHLLCSVFLEGDLSVNQGAGGRKAPDSSFAVW